MNRIRKAVVLLVIGTLIWTPSQIHAQGEPLPRGEGRLKGFQGVVLSGGSSWSGEDGTYRIKDVNTGQEQTFLVDGTTSQVELPGKSVNVDRAGALTPATAPTDTPATTARPVLDPTILMEDIAEAAQLLAAWSIDRAFALVVDDLNNDRLADKDHRLGDLGEALAKMEQGASLFNAGKADKAIKQYEKAWKAARKAYDFDKAPFYFEPTAQPIDPVPTIIMVRDNLELTAALDLQVQDHIAEATNKIDEALKPAWWTGSTVLNKDVFKKLTDAIANLEMVLEHENATGGEVDLAQKAIYYLLVTEQYLAETQIGPAKLEVLADVQNRTLQKGDKRLADLGSAFKDLTGAAEEQSEAKYKKASDSYKKAWEHAMKAIS